MLMDDHRPWGWRIVSNLRYRDIQDEETRRLQNRDNKRRQRKRKRERGARGADGQRLSSPAINSHQRQQMSEQTVRTGKSNAKHRDRRSLVSSFTLVLSGRKMGGR